MKLKFLKSAIAAFVILTSCAPKQAPIELFNGKDLSNWNLFIEEDSTVTAADVFTVKDGVIDIKGNPFGYMYTKEIYDNFDLHVEWRWSDGVGTNSGIFLFVQEPAKVWPNAIECQLHKGDAGDFVLLGGSDVAEFKLKEGETRPEFPVVQKKAESSELAVGEWNQADITCKDGNITVKINGKLQNNGSKPLFKSGHIGLQSEGGPIQFRNVKLTPIK